MFHTPLCERLGIAVPVIAAPMGPELSSPALAAAVSNAGGLGLVSFGGYPPPALRHLIRGLRERTYKPFGVNVILDPALTLPFDRREAIATCIEQRVPVLSLPFGDPTPTSRGRMRLGWRSSIRSGRSPRPSVPRAPGSTS